MSVWQWILVAEFVISGLAMMWRTASGEPRQYTVADLIFGIPELAFLVWIVAVKL